MEKLNWFESLKTEEKTLVIELCYDMVHTSFEILKDSKLKEYCIESIKNDDKIKNLKMTQELVDIVIKMYNKDKNWLNVTIDKLKTELLDENIPPRKIRDNGIKNLKILAKTQLKNKTQ